MKSTLREHLIYTINRMDVKCAADFHTDDWRCPHHFITRLASTQKEHTKGVNIPVFIENVEETPTTLQLH